MIYFQKEDEHCGCGHNHEDGECCHGEHNHENCEHDDCNCEECESNSSYITFEDEETGEKFKALMLFNSEVEGKTIYYAAFGDLEDEDSEVTVIPLEEDKEGHLVPIDINTDPRSEELKNIFDDWQAQMSALADEEANKTQE